MNPLAPIAYCGDNNSIVSVVGRRFDRNYVNVIDIFTGSEGTILESKLTYLSLEYADLMQYDTFADLKHDYPHFFI